MASLHSRLREGDKVKNLDVQSRMPKTLIFCKAAGLKIGKQNYTPTLLNRFEQAKPSCFFNYKIVLFVCF